MRALPGTMGEGGAAFASTHWSMVMRCADDDSQAAELSRTALETLCRDYWPPLYSFVRRRGHSSAEAQDLVQGFFVHLLKTRAYGKADPEMGKFRTFLIHSLKNFLANVHDHERRLKRGGDQNLVPLDDHLAEAEAAVFVADKTGLAADWLFERRWASTILAHAWDTLRSETEAKGGGALLDALRPYLTAGAGAPPAQEEVAARIGLPLVTLRTHVHRFRERFRLALRTEVARTLSAGADVDEELSYLRRILIGDPGVS